MFLPGHASPALFPARDGRRRETPAPASWIESGPGSPHVSHRVPARPGRRRRGHRLRGQRRLAVGAAVAPAGFSYRRAARCTPTPRVASHIGRMPRGRENRRNAESLTRRRAGSGRGSRGRLRHGRRQRPARRPHARRPHLGPGKPAGGRLRDGRAGGFRDCRARHPVPVRDRRADHPAARARQQRTCQHLACQHLAVAPAVAIAAPPAEALPAARLEAAVPAAWRAPAAGQAAAPRLSQAAAPARRRAARRGTARPELAVG